MDAELIFFDTFSHDFRQVSFAMVLDSDCNLTFKSGAEHRLDSVPVSGSHQRNSNNSVGSTGRSPFPEWRPIGVNTHSRNDNKLKHLSLF